MGGGIAYGGYKKRLYPRGVFFETDYAAEGAKTGKGGNIGASMEKPIREKKGRDGEKRTEERTALKTRERKVVPKQNKDKMEPEKVLTTYRNRK